VPDIYLDDDPKGMRHRTCPYHKLNPYVLMVQSTKDGPCFDTPCAVNEPSNRRILA